MFIGKKRYTHWCQKKSQCINYNRGNTEKTICIPLKGTAYIKFFISICISKRRRHSHRKTGINPNKQKLQIHNNGDSSYPIFSGKRHRRSIKNNCCDRDCQLIHKLGRSVYHTVKSYLERQSSKCKFQGMFLLHKIVKSHRKRK